MTVRLSFDFRTEQAMLEFWDDFKAANRGPCAEQSWDNCAIMHKDSLHDMNGVKEYLIRGASPYNGRKI